MRIYERMETMVKLRHVKTLCIILALAVVSICFLFYRFVNDVMKEHRSRQEFPVVVTSPSKNRNTRYSKMGTRRQDTTPTMIWWDSVYKSLNEIRDCGQYRCHVTNDHSFQNYPNTQMFIFYASHFKPFALPLPRGRNHLWALLHEESPRNAYIFLHPPTVSIFNFTSTYSQFSDYPITTQWLQCADWIHDTTYMMPLEDKNKLRDDGIAPILYIQSDCPVPSDRDNFVKVLQNYIPVDSYGSCLNNKKMPDRFRFGSNMEAMNDPGFLKFAARYKFTLATENYICNDYITEKLWRPIRLGSVPIVLGAPNIKEYLPSNYSAIVVADFSTIEALAEYIKILDSNNTLYRRYIQYKNEPVRNKHLKTILENRNWNSEMCNSIKQNNKYQSDGRNYREHKSFFTGYECFLCKNIHEMNSDKSEFLKAANLSHFQCPPPKRFYQNGRYSLDDADWAFEWYYGKYEAAAVMQLYKDQTMVPKKDYHALVRRLSNLTKPWV